MKKSLFNKKIKLGRFGFSLVEVLAAIVILGILTTIAIISVSRIIEKAKRNHYATQEKNIILGAQSFFETTKDTLPKSLGQSRMITLRELINAKYIDKVLDYNKNECDPDNSYVKVTKYTDTKYSYAVYLSCPIADYHTQTKGNPNFEGPIIEIDYTGAYKESSVKTTISDSDGIISYSYIVDKKLNDGSNKRVEINNSGEKLGNTKKSITEIISLVGNIPGDFYFTVKATDIYGNTTTYKKHKEITDQDGPECGDTISVRIKDENIVVDVSKNNQSTWESTLGWVNKNRIVTVTCRDSASGCKKNVYEQEFDKDTNMSYIKIVDNVGNTTKCKVPVFIDKTAPVIDVTDNPKKSTTDDYSVKWVNTSYAVTLKGHDPNFDTNSSKNKSSGFAYYAYTYPESKRTSDDGNPESSVHIYEKDGNNSRVKANQVNAAKTNAFEFTTDNFSKERNMYVHFILCDKAGNCSKPEKDGSITRIKIDKTDPKINTVSNPYENTWTNAPRADSGKDEYVIDIESVDPEPFEVSNGAIKYPGENEQDLNGNSIELKNRITSGIVKYSYRYPRANNPRISGDGTSEKLWHQYDVSTSTMLTYKNSDLTKVTTSAFKKDREEYVEFQICDKAGNCSYIDDSSNSKKCTDSRNGKGNCVCDSSGCHNTAKSMIKIDTMPPTCTNRGGTGQGDDKWINYAITLFGDCDDPLSPDPDGVHSKCVQDTVSTPVNNYANISPGTVADNAGNTTNCLAEIVQIDLVKPKITSVTNRYDNSWTNAPIDTSKAKYRIDLTGEDYGFVGHASGLKYYAFTYPTSTRTASDGTSESGAWHEYDGSSGKYPLYSKTADLTAVTTSTFSAERDMQVVFEVCDRAGNCSDPVVDNSNSTIRIDTTKPVIDTVVNNYNSDGNTWQSATVLAANGDGYTIDITSHDPLTYTPNENISSGLAKHSYSYNPTLSWTDYSNSNSENFTTTKFTAERNQNVYFRVCDNAGNCSDSKTSNIKIDNTAPKCEVTGGNTSWINLTSATQVSTVKAKCVEQGSIKSNCRSDTAEFEHNYTYDTDGNLNITNGGALGVGSGGAVYDNAGNKTDCAANKTVRIDKEAPQCSPTAVAEKDWIKGTRNIAINCTDNFGCNIPDSSKNKTYSSGTVLTDKVELKDIANNKADCNFNVYVDNDAPNCASATNASTTWKKSKTITPGCTEVNNGSGCATPSAITYNSTTKPNMEITTDSATIYDNVGNSRSCTFDVYVDNKAPNVPTVNMKKWKDNSDEPNNNNYTAKTNGDYSSGWVNKKIYTYPSGSTDSGVGGVYYQYTTTGKTANKTDYQPTNPYRNVEAQGTSTIKWRACDSLNNCSSYSGVKTIKFDRKSPTVSIYYSTTGTNALYYTGSAVDNKPSEMTDNDVSGISTNYRFIQCAETDGTWRTGGNGSNYKTQYQKYATKSSERRSYKLQVTDNAGNVGTSSCSQEYLKCTTTKDVADYDSVAIYRWSSVASSSTTNGRGEPLSNCSINATIHKDDWEVAGGVATGPYIQVYMDVDICKCTYDSVLFSQLGQNDSYCSGAVNTPRKSRTDYHTDEMAIIVYQNNSKGKSACEGRKNTYVQYACEALATGGSSPAARHGVRFYSDDGKYWEGWNYINDSYTIPIGTGNKWVYSGLNKTTTGLSDTKACQTACQVNGKVTSLS